MTTPADPMPIDEALRIIRNVADHNPHDIPSPGQVAEAVGKAIIQADRVSEELAKVCERIEKASLWMSQASSVLEDAWHILKDLER